MKTFIAIVVTIPLALILYVIWGLHKFNKDFKLSFDEWLEEDEQLFPTNNDEDETLLEYYQKGFRDELNGTSSTVQDGILLKAYSLGVLHAMVGDDVRSVDYLTNEEILKQIRDEIKN